MNANLRGEIIKRASKLFTEADEFKIATIEDYTKELNEQFQEGNYNQYLRSGLGFEIEQGSKEAREVMKLLIKYNLGAVKAPL